jgi:hypothetical protein
VPEAPCDLHMLAKAVAAVSASAMLLLLCCVANMPNYVSLFQPHYPPSNFRQGPREFSPFSPEGGVPPVYSAEDVNQRNVWTGYNQIEPVFAAYSYTPSAIHMPLSTAPLLRQRRQSSIISRDHVPDIASALRRSTQQIRTLQQQVSNLQNVVHNAMKQPILDGKLFAHKQQSKLAALSAWVRELQIRISRMESMSVPRPEGLQSRKGPPLPRRFKGAGVQGLNGPRAAAAHNGVISRVGPKGFVLTASEARRIFDTVANLNQELEFMQEGHRRMPNFGNSAPIAVLKRQAHKVLVHRRRIASTSIRDTSTAKSSQRAIATHNIEGRVSTVNDNIAGYGGSSVASKTRGLLLKFDAISKPGMTAGSRSLKADHAPGDAP